MGRPRRLLPLRLALVVTALAVLPGGLGADTWTHVKGGKGDPLPGCFRSAVFAGDLLVAVGDSGLCETTTTPLVKSSYVKRNAATTENLYGIAYGNGMFVAVGYHGVIVTSTNGTSWTLRCPYEDNGTFPLGRSLIGIAYGDGLWVAGGIDGRVKTSPDGITWTERGAAPNGARINAIAYRNGTWVAAAGGGYIYYSSNGINWARASSAPSDGQNLYSALATATNFTVGGRLGMCLTSSNGSSWTRSTTNTQDYLMSLCDDGRHYVACGNYDFGGCSQIVASANNGANWVRDRTDDTSTLYAIAQGNGYVVALGNRSLVQANTVADIGDGRGCGVTSSMRVISPNGGEFLKSGTTWSITWDSTAVTDPIRIRYSDDDGADGYAHVIINQTENSGSYSWVVPNIKSTKCRVKVLAANSEGIPSDISNATFEIGDTPTTGGIALTSPKTGDILAGGANHTITWTTSRSFDTIDLRYYNGSGWLDIVRGIPNSGSYNWTVPNINVSNAQMVIWGYSSAGNASYKTGLFTIGSGNVDAITITSPKGGDQLTGGGLEVITWVGTKVFDTVTLRYYDGTGWADIIRDTGDTGSYPWIVPNVNASQAQLVIKGVSSTGEALYKTEYFSIVAGSGIQVISPAPGDAWVPGFTYNVGWTRSGAMVETVHIQLFKGGSYLMDMASNTANDLNEGWTVPAQLAYGDDYQVRVVTSDDQFAGISGLFSVSPPPSLTVVHPGSGSGFIVGTTQPVNWTKAGKQSATVMIELFRDGAKLQTVAAAAPNSGTYSWAVPALLDPGEGYVLRVTTAGGEASDDSEPFSILPATIVVVAPAMSALWQAGSTQTISWQKLGGMDDRVRIELYQNGVLVATISESTANSGSFTWAIPAELGVGGSNLSDWGLDNFLPRDSGGNNGVVQDGMPYWTVPLDPSLGGVYLLKIVTLDGRVTGTSDLFIIGAAE